MRRRARRRRAGEISTNSTPSMRPSNANDKATVAINCNKIKATRPRHGRRTNLEARRLLGVEAQDAGLRCRAPPAARSPRRSFALLERAAARPSRRRGPLRRVGLVAGHYLWSVLCPLRPSLVASTGQRRSLPFMLLARALVSCAAQCKSQTKHAITNSQRPSAPLHDSRPGARRLQRALPLAADAVDCKERPTSPRLSGLWQTHSEADTCSCYVPHTAAQASRIGVATRTNGLCSVVSKAACARVAAV